MIDDKRRVWEHLAAMQRPKSIAERRAVYDALFSEFKLAPDITAEPVSGPGFRGEWLTPPDAEEGRALLYMHGGGYVRGSLQSHGHMVGEIARAARCRVLNLDYRLAPEHRFPAAVEDTLAAYAHLLETGLAPERIALAGDSAGAGLVVAAMLKLRDEGGRLPACGWSLSGWFDMEALGESMRLKEQADPYVRREFILALAQDYLGDGDRRHPLAAPIHADLRGLPPLLLQVGSAETLLDDSVEFCRRAALADLRVTLEIWPDMAHVWHLFFTWLEDARKAVAAGGAFVLKQTGGAA